MKRDSTIIAIAIMASASVIFAVLVYFLGKNSNNYEAGEEFRLVSIVFAISAILDFMFYWLRGQHRKNQYFKMTRSGKKEPDSPELQKFKEEQRMFLYLFLVHAVLFVVFSLVEFMI